MYSKHRWRIHVKNMETTIKVGIHDHERTPQRVLVNVTVEGIYPAKPATIDECYNYDHVHQLVVNQWPSAPHKMLLEHCVTELLEHIFLSDKRVDFAIVRVCKPDIFANAEAVGVEAEWTREDFENYR